MAWLPVAVESVVIRCRGSCLNCPSKWLMSMYLELLVHFDWRDWFLTRPFLTGEIALSLSLSLCVSVSLMADWA